MRKNTIVLTSYGSLKVFLGESVVTFTVVESGCDFLMDLGGLVVDCSGGDPLVVYPSGSTT